MLLNELPEENTRKRGRGQVIPLWDSMPTPHDRDNRDYSAIAAILNKLEPSPCEHDLDGEEEGSPYQIPPDPIAEQKAVWQAVEQYIRQLPGFRTDEEVLSGHWMGTFSEKREGKCYVFPIKATMQLVEGEISGECMTLDDYGKTYRETHGYFHGQILANSNVWVYFQNTDPQMNKHSGRIDLKVDRDRYTAKGRFVGHGPNGRQVIGEIEISKYADLEGIGIDVDKNLLGIKGKVDAQRRRVRQERIVEG